MDSDMNINVDNIGVEMNEIKNNYLSPPEEHLQYTI